MSMRAGEAGYGDDDRLPWLETIEEDYREGPSIWRILLLILLAVAVLAAVLFGFWWYQHQQGLSGNGQLINAQEGDYKVPDRDAGMNVEGAGTTTFSTSQGAPANTSVDAGAQPEAPVEGKVVAAQPTPAASGSKTATVTVANGGALKAQAPAAPAAQPAAALGSGSGALIQLGAFPDQQGADAAWVRLSKRFGYLAPLGKSVEKGDKDGNTVYRLRVNAGSNGQARDICTKLKAAGENCYVAN